VIVLNSEIVVNNVFAEEERKAQLDWLAADLKANQKKCRQPTGCIPLQLGRTRLGLPTRGVLGIAVSGAPSSS
jgi:hypothetical protein